MNIPFVNLRRHHQNLQPALTQTFGRIIDRGQLMGGEEVAGFEQNFADYIGVPYGVACGNGTDALELILRAFNIGTGDEVIVPANAWMSAAEMVSLLGATPVFADTDPAYYTLNADLLEPHITARTKAIIPIHLYGLPADMPAIMRIARKHDLKVIEDCAQSHGAAIGAQRTGSFGDAAAFSFYPTKNLGAMGDGGMVLTQDASLAQKVRMIAQHGQREKNVPVCQGRNSRMDTLQAAILRLKLPLLDGWNQRRQTIAWHYRQAWQENDLALPEAPAGFDHIYHLFVVRHTQRDRLAAHLRQAGIATEVHYPYALPAMPVYQPLADPATCPVAMQQANELLSIPVYPELTDAEVDYIVEKVGEWLKK